MESMAGRTSIKKEAKVKEPISKQSKSESTQIESNETAVDRVLWLQRTVGNPRTTQLLRSRTIQAKLTVGAPNDIYEQEADRLADRVMRMPEIRETIRTKSNASRTPEVTPGIEASILSLKGGGQPLPDDTRFFFESRFGADFTHVRVHTGDSAIQTTQAIDAKAYTMENNIVFDRGQYSPNSTIGKQLLAHELTHVVQQGAGEATLQSTSIMQTAVSNQFVQRFTEKNHLAIEKDALEGYSQEEMNLISFGNWQNDFNQITLLDFKLGEICSNLNDEIRAVRDTLKEAVSGLKEVLNNLTFLKKFDISIDKKNRIEKMINSLSESAEISVSIPHIVFFEIGKVVAEAKFGKCIADQMKPSRFGRYDPRQHFETIREKSSQLDDTAVPPYIFHTKEYLGQLIRDATDSKYDSESVSIQKELYGSALHIIEDFFAHTNFVEIASAIFFDEKKIQNTFAGKVQFGADKGRFQLVSGGNELADTADSMLTLLAEYLEGKLDDESGLTVSNKIMLILIRHVNPSVAKFYEEFLYLSEDISCFLKRKFPWIYKEFFNLKVFIIGEIRRIIGEGKKGLIALSNGELFTEGDKRMSPRLTQPMHCNVNKDAPGRPNYKLAKKLATYVVREIDKSIKKVWKERNIKDKIFLRNELLKKIYYFLSHPDQVRWWHKIYEEFFNRCMK